MFCGILSVKQGKANIGDTRCLLVQEPGTVGP